jgi:hypothetical protein
VTWAFASSARFRREAVQAAWRSCTDKPLQRGANRRLLPLVRRRHRHARQERRHALERLRVLHASGEVVSGERVPQPQQAFVQILRRGVIARSDGVPQPHVRVWRCREDRSDRAVCAERVGRIEQRIDGGENQVLGPRRDEQIGQQFQITRALFHADDVGHLAHDAQQQRG